jgi:hypothetical protein
MFLITIIFISLTTSSLAFAQMESMKITGPKYPLLNSIFTIKVTIEGTSRASYGDFSTTMYLIDKEKGIDLDAFPLYLLSGENSVIVNLKSLVSTEKVQSGKYYIVKIQHTNIISEFEFTPILPGEEKPKETPIEQPIQDIPIVTQDVINLDKYNSGSDGSSIKVISAIETGRPNQYLIYFEICAGTKKVTVPEVTVSSDSESYTREVATVLNPGSCYLVDSNVEADEPTTIDVTFGNVVKDDTQIVELKAEISELKEELKKKDAVLMEQLKVIQNLASMIKKVFFDSFLNYFQLV